MAGESREGSGGSRNDGGPEHGGPVGCNRIGRRKIMDSFDKAVLESIRRNSGQVMQALGDDLVTDIKDIFAIHFSKQMNDVIEGKIYNVHVRTRDDRIRKIVLEESDKIFRERLRAILNLDTES
jgi:hypothetical protein